MCLTIIRAMLVDELTALEIPLLVVDLLHNHAILPEMAWILQVVDDSQTVRCNANFVLDQILGEGEGLPACICFEYRGLSDTLKNYG